jgi:hypothetical protein
MGKAKLRGWLVLAAAMVVGLLLGAVASDLLLGSDQGPDMRLPAGDRDAPDVTDKAYERMLDRLDVVGSDAKVLDDATPGQRILFTLRTTELEIDDGGLAGMFGNLDDAVVTEAERSARRIGATAYADVLAAAIARRSDPRALAALDPRVRDDMFSRQLLAYVRRHPDEFFKEAPS